MTETIPTIPTIGVVGGIGSGKSLVANLMASRGGYLIDADQLGHEALRQPGIRKQLIARWGTGILNEAGEADRKKLGRLVFADPEELRALEALVFPYIVKRIKEEIKKARTHTNSKFVILDAAIMMETGWHAHCDKILFVDTPRAIRLQRLQEKRGWSEKELRRREKAQMPLKEKKRRADVVIVNDAGPDKVARQVQDALESLNIMC